jgi:PKD repeat protein
MKQILFSILLIGALLSCNKDEEQPEVKACFGHQPTTINDGQVQFTNCSENAKSYFWNFGDGTTSTEFEPSHLYSGSFPYNVMLIAYNGNNSDTIAKPLYDEIMVYKPNIYIYPLVQTRLCVQLSFPMGGNIVESTPEYTNGWCVNIEPNGRINNQFDYLFYESKQPNVFQYEEGWCVSQANLKSFFEKNMALYNFSSAEIKDFINYWIPLLTKDNYYCIYPQTNVIIDKIIQLDFSARTDKIHRLFYGVVGTNEFSKLIEPKILPFERTGFYVVEWGVFRK